MGLMDELYGPEARKREEEARKREEDKDMREDNINRPAGVTLCAIWASLQFLCIMVYVVKIILVVLQHLDIIILVVMLVMLVMAFIIGRISYGLFKIEYGWGLFGGMFLAGINSFLGIILIMTFIKGTLIYLIPTIISGLVFIYLILSQDVFTKDKTKDYEKKADKEKNGIKEFEEQKEFKNHKELYNKGIALLKEGKLKEASEILKETARLIPDSAPVQFTLGVTYAKIAGMEDDDKNTKSKLHEMSSESFRKAVELASKHGGLNEEQIALAKKYCA